MKNKKEAIRLLRIVKREVSKLHTKAWHGNAITVGQSNNIRMALKYTFNDIEKLIKEV